MSVLLVLTKRASFLRRPVVYSFFKDRIEIKTAASECTVQWAILVMIREMNQRVLLDSQKKMWCSLYRNAVLQMSQK